MHGGLSTGAQTAEGKIANRHRAKAQMIDPWVALRAAGKTAVQLSPDGRQRLRDAARRTVRMRHRKRQALEGCDWMLNERADWTVRM
jgi:hypothetical protein